MDIKNKIICKLCKKKVEPNNNRSRNQKYCRKCKEEAIKEYQREWYLDNRKEVMKKSNERYKDNKPEIKKKQLKYYHKNKKGINKKRKGYMSLYYQLNKKTIKPYRENWSKDNKPKINRYAKKNRIKNPKKIKARNKARYIKDKITICQICNKNKATSKHHKDYNKPLEVMFLCKKCHLKLHNKNEVKL